MSLDDLKKIPYGKTSIELKNISLAFGGVKALTDVSFDIKKGEVFAIIGPRGCISGAFLTTVWLLGDHLGWIGARQRNE